RHASTRRPPLQPPRAAPLRTSSARRARAARTATRAAPGPAPDALTTTPAAALPGPASARARVPGRPSGGGRCAAAPRAQEQPCDPDHDDRDDRVVEHLEMVLPVLPLRAGLVADEAEREDERQRAQHGEPAE